MEDRRFKQVIVGDARWMIGMSGDGRWKVTGVEDGLYLQKDVVDDSDSKQVIVQYDGSNGGLD